MRKFSELPQAIGLILAVLFICSTAIAAPILVTGADLADSRSTVNGLLGQGRWSAAGVSADGRIAVEGLSIRWDISHNGVTNLWEYEYYLGTESGDDPSPGVSHLILELSDSITPDNFDSLVFGLAPGVSRGDDNKAELDWLADADGSTGTSPGGNNGNPNMPAALHGMKFDVGDDDDALVAISFTSVRAPIWGDFYAKSGSGIKASKLGGGDPVEWTYATTAWNTGFGSDPTSGTTDFTGWIPTPDTLDGPPPIPPFEVIPEPATLALFGLGALGIAIHRRRKR